MGSRRRRRSSEPGCQKGIVLGESLRWLLEQRAQRYGTSVSIEMVQLIQLCGMAPAPPPLDDETRYLDTPDATQRHVKPTTMQGRVTAWAPPAVWEAVDERARRFGESRSEAVRALVYGGLAVEPLLGEPREPRERARRRRPAQLRLPGLEIGKKRHPPAAGALRVPRSVAGVVQMIELLARSVGADVVVNVKECA